MIHADGCFNLDVIDADGLSYFISHSKDIPVISFLVPFLVYVSFCPFFPPCFHIDGVVAMLVKLVGLALLVISYD